MPELLNWRVDDVIAGKKWVHRHHKWRIRLYTALAARYRINQGFQSTIRRMSERRNLDSPKARESIILRKWVEQMELDGDTIDIVLKGWVPREEHLIIASAVNDQGLDRAADFLRKSIERRGMIISALYYPVLLVIMMLGMMIVIGTQVMPTIIAMQTRQGIEPSFLLAFLTSHGWLFPLPFLALYFAVRYSFTHWSGQWRVYADSCVWPWSHYRRIQANIFLMAYSCLWMGGRTEITTLYAMAETGNLWLRDRISAIARYVEDGFSLGHAMSNAGYGFPSPEIIDDICDIEATPDEMGQHLMRIAEENSREMQERFSRMATISGLLLMAMVSLMLLFIVGNVTSAMNVSEMLEMVNKDIR